jgi:hypothetical protein
MHKHCARHLRSVFHTLQEVNFDTQEQCLSLWMNALFLQPHSSIGLGVFAPRDERSCDHCDRKASSSFRTDLPVNGKVRPRYRMGPWPPVRVESEKIVLATEPWFFFKNLRVFISRNLFVFSLPTFTWTFKYVNRKYCSKSKFMVSRLDN